MFTPEEIAEFEKSLDEIEADVKRLERLIERHNKIMKIFDIIIGVGLSISAIGLLLYVFFILS